MSSRHTPFLLLKNMEIDMKRSIWDNGKISVIVHLKNPANQNRIIEMFQNFMFPDFYKTKLKFAYGKTSAEAFSKIRDNAGLKIFTTDSILQINPEIWEKIAYVDMGKKFIFPNHLFQ